ncbi:hypothetical protein [Aureimonas sp. D3]|uniref:hypothetical protein n=1 Tax=Aureimonas sp. D3 TaxID=1638164 RepID=UPI0012E3CBA9|nr:hypothetical protein [Aureimonas sp. D3]
MPRPLQVVARDALVPDPPMHFHAVLEGDVLAREMKRLAIGGRPVSAVTLSTLGSGRPG